MRRPMSHLLLVIVLVLAACGGSGDDGAGDTAGSDNGGGASSDADFDRCSLMSAEEAAQWIGSPVDLVGPSDVPVGADETCVYASSPNETRILLQIRDGAQFFAEEGSGARGPDTIEGIGEDAHSDGSYIEFLEGGFTVRVSQIQGAISLDELKDIAQLIEGRLP